MSCESHRPQFRICVRGPRVEQSKKTIERGLENERTCQGGEALPGAARVAADIELRGGKDVWEEEEEEEEEDDDDKRGGAAPAGCSVRKSAAAASAAAAAATMTRSEKRRGDTLKGTTRPQTESFQSKSVT